MKEKENYQRYLSVTRGEISKYRVAMKEDLDFIYRSGGSVDRWVREFLDGLKVEKELAFDLVSYGLMANGFFDELEILTRIEFEKSFPSHPYMIFFYLSALLANGKAKQIESVLRKNFDLVKDEWLRLGVAEIVCDAGLWALAADLKKGLSWSGTASKIRYTRINKRVDLSLVDSRLPEFNCVYVNLEKDLKKKNRIERHLKANNMLAFRSPGVFAKDLPRYALSLVNRSETLSLQVGAIGCFLGHLGAIEMVLEEGLSHALILEDDAYFYYRPTEFAIQRILENEFDILYVNSRMMKQGYNITNPFSAVSIKERLAEFPDARSGWGGDGYIISRAGATKLLENMMKDKIVGHFDGQLGSYGLIGMDVGDQTKALRTGASFVAKFSAKSKFINVKCLDFPLVSCKDFGSSSRVRYS